MRIFFIILIGLLVSNCQNSYVKNKKTIVSPNDLQKFVNVYCDKNKQTDKVIKVCGNGWSKDLNISENKAILSAKLKIADITQHSIVSNEVITHKESNKGIINTYDLTADSKIEDVSISGYKIVNKKVLKEKNGWRTLRCLEGTSHSNTYDAPRHRSSDSGIPVPESHNRVHPYSQRGLPESGRKGKQTLQKTSRQPI